MMTSSCLSLYELTSFSSRELFISAETINRLIDRKSLDSCDYRLNECFCYSNSWIDFYCQIATLNDIPTNTAPKKDSVLCLFLNTFP